MLEAIGQDTDAVVLCGGLGQRLGALTDHTPKPLLLVKGRPLIFRILDQLDSLSIRRIIFVVRYRREQLEHAVRNYGWAGEPPELIWVDQHYPESEGAVLTGAEAATSARALIRCGDDLLSDVLVTDLLMASGGGAVMTRNIADTSLPRIQSRGGQIIAASDDHSLPIMTYNLCLRTDLLREWARGAVERSEPLAGSIRGFISAGLSAVDGTDSIGINHPADFLTAEAWLADLTKEQR